MAELSTLDNSWCHDAILFDVRFKKDEIRLRFRTFNWPKSGDRKTVNLLVHDPCKVDLSPRAAQATSKFEHEMNMQWWLQDGCFVIDQFGTHFQYLWQDTGEDAELVGSSMELLIVDGWPA